MKAHLITPSEVVNAGRPMGSQVDKERLLSYITETEMMYVKPVLGERLYLSLLEDETDSNAKYAMLLNGGSYSVNGEMFTFVGLKAAISYFVFAKNVMVGDFVPTRFGIVMKEADYSSHISTAERSACYNDTLEVAHSYLQDCVAYCRRMGLLTNSIGSPTASGGIRIRKIG